MALGRSLLPERLIGQKVCSSRGKFKDAHFFSFCRLPPSNKSFRIDVGKSLRSWSFAKLIMGNCCPSGESEKRESYGESDVVSAPPTKTPSPSTASKSSVRTKSAQPTKSEEGSHVYTHHSHMRRLHEKAEMPYRRTSPDPHRSHMRKLHELAGLKYERVPQPEMKYQKNILSSPPSSLKGITKVTKVTEEATKPPLDGEEAESKPDSVKEATKQKSEETTGLKTSKIQADGETGGEDSKEKLTVGTTGTAPPPAGKFHVLSDGEDPLLAGGAQAAFGGVEAVAEVAAEAAEVTVDAIAGAAETAKGAADYAAGAVADTAQDAADAAGAAVAGAAEAAREGAATCGDAAEGAGEAVRGGAASCADAAAEVVDEGVGTCAGVGRSAEHAADSCTDAAIDAVDQSRAMCVDAGDVMLGAVDSADEVTFVAVNQCATATCNALNAVVDTTGDFVVDSTEACISLSRQPLKMMANCSAPVSRAVSKAKARRTHDSRGKPLITTAAQETDSKWKDKRIVTQTGKRKSGAAKVSKATTTRRKTTSKKESVVLSKRSPEGGSGVPPSQRLGIKEKSQSPGKAAVQVAAPAEDDAINRPVTQIPDPQGRFDVNQNTITCQDDIEYFLNCC